MKHLKLFESFDSKPYDEINRNDFNPEDRSELFQSEEVVMIKEILKVKGYDVVLENIFYNETENLDKVSSIKGKKTSPLANGDKYYKDDVVLYKLDDYFFDVYFAKITEIPEQTRLERLRGHKAIPISKITYYRADQLDGLEILVEDKL